MARPGGAGTRPAYRARSHPDTDPAPRRGFRALGGTLAIGLGLAQTACTTRVEVDTELPTRDPTKRWSAVLVRELEDGQPDLDGLASERELLEKFLAWSGEHGPEQDEMRESQEDRRISMMLNAHNAAVIHGLLRHREDSSRPSPAAGLEGPFFRRLTWRVDGEWMSLHRLAEQQIVGRYQDPLIWVGVWTSLDGAPPLEWWPSKDLTQVMEARLRGWLAAEDGPLRPAEGAEGGGYALSAFFWERRSDFTDWSDAATLCEWLLPYATGPRATWLESQAASCEPPVFPLGPGLGASPAVDPSASPG